MAEASPGAVPLALAAAIGLFTVAAVARPGRSSGLRSVQLVPDTRRGVAKDVVEDARRQGKRWAGPVAQGDVTPEGAFDISNVGYPSTNTATYHAAKKAFVAAIQRKLREWGEPLP